MAARRDAEAARRDAVEAGKQIALGVAARGALRSAIRDLSVAWDIHDAGCELNWVRGEYNASSEDGLASFLESHPFGAHVLQCANDNSSVVGDNKGQPHTAASLAKLLQNIHGQLNAEARDRRFPKERAGKPLQLNASGLHYSEQFVLSCLLDIVGFRVQPLVA